MVRNAIPQPIDTWVVSGFFAVTNNAAMNFRVEVFVWTYVFSSLGWIQEWNRQAMYYYV